MEERHGMAWGPWRILFHHTIKDGLFYGFHSGVIVHVINLYQNWLTHVIKILSAPKLLTELRLGYNYFNRNFPSNILNLDRLNKIYIFHNPGIIGNDPSKIGNMTGLMYLVLYFTSLHGNTPLKFDLIKDLFYLGMDETHINGPIPYNL